MLVPPRHLHVLRRNLMELLGAIILGTRLRGDHHGGKMLRAPFGSRDLLF